MQAETAAGDDDRASIIDAAYRCLLEPHSGAIPVAAILQRAGVSTRAFYRHFGSKDELFLALLHQVTDMLAARLDRICADVPGGPVDQVRAWISGMFEVIHDDQMRMQFSVVDSDEVRAAKGYREARERSHANRERSLVGILRRGREDGTFPLADPEGDAVAISAVISRAMTTQHYECTAGVQLAQNNVLDFALRALGATPR